MSSPTTSGVRRDSLGAPNAERPCACPNQVPISPQETVLRLESDAYGLPEAHVNYEIIDHIRGSGTMKVDIAYPDDRVCIEYDGNYHYTHGRWMYDLDKRNRLRDLGFTPFVATREHLASKQKLNELFGMVARAIASHRYGLD